MFVVCWHRCVCALQPLVSTGKLRNESQAPLRLAAEESVVGAVGEWGQAVRRGVGGVGWWMDSGGLLLALFTQPPVKVVHTLWHHMGSSGPRNICYFLHRLFTARFRLQACRKLLNTWQEHRAKEAAGLVWPSELHSSLFHSLFVKTHPFSSKAWCMQLGCM